MKIDLDKMFGKSLDVFEKPFREWAESLSFENSFQSKDELRYSLQYAVDTISDEISIIDIEIPGFDKSEIKIEWRYSNTIYITAKTDSKYKGADIKVANLKEIKAKLKNGVLTLTCLTAPPQHNPVEIEISE
jgi:HSP20 family molecular chaperone IbpA